MAQPQSQAPPRAFSPPQHSPSPASSQTGFPLPSKSRPRPEGASSQPESPYAGSPYVASPAATATPPPAVASPSYSQPVNTPGAYPVPYTNGNSTPTLSLPNPQPRATPPPASQSPQLAQPVANSQYTAATMAPSMQPGMPTAPTGAMGPPQRPAERPTKEPEYEVTDMLSGTGIDLNAEEKYMADMFTTSFDGSSEARTGLAQHTAGSKVSFYGAGPANQAAEAKPDPDQDKFAQEAAERAWRDSSMHLAMQRTQELRDPFLTVAMLHRRADKIAREHGIGLNLDYKTNPASLGKMKVAEQFPNPKVTVTFKPGPDSTAVATTGSFVPHDAYLVDQLALMSIASKSRLRDLLEEAAVIASTRQKTSHGEVPGEWAEAAAPVNQEPLSNAMDVDAAVPDSAVSPGTNPLKRTPGDAPDENGAPAAKLPKIGSYMTTTMRELAKKEREWEEARLRRRQKRRDGVPDQASSTSRAQSAAPGTPGSIAPEPEKAMTKKEMKKNQALKAAEANSHANQNLTSSMFAGLGGKSGLFGKKKSGKSYAWMNAGGGGSGVNTPTKGTPGGIKGASGAVGSPSPANMALTTEGRNRLGGWREDKEKGKKIQLRDWVSVLERDGRASKALQHAYVRLDLSDPR